MTQRFSYDDEHRISQVTIEGDAEYTRAEYRYDAPGRRTEKQVWRRYARKPERTQYALSGLQMVDETSDSHPDAAVQYIYTENSYEPLARVDSHGEHADIFWYHTELNGLPDSVTDSNGETVWRGASSAWGRSLRESTPVNWDTPQNLRFQGQYLDRETGLHYNTFRYYDPAAGCYTQMDPIGLLGGLNTYTYVVDPLGWIDPLGLKCSHLAKNPKQLHAAIKDKWGHSMTKRDMRELQNTVDRIKLNKPRYSNDGTPFSNSHTMGNPNSQRLDTGSGPYREWTVKTPDVGTNGARRIVVDSKTGRAYYTHDHYDSFVEIELGGWK